MQKINEREIVEIVRSELERCKKEHKLDNQSAFGIIAGDDIGYAIPVDGEKIPCITLEEKTRCDSVMGYKTFSMLCKNSRGMKIAIAIGDIWDSFRFFVKHLPDWHKESINYELKEELLHGIFIYHGIACNGYQFYFIEFE